MKICGGNFQSEYFFIDIVPVKISRVYMKGDTNNVSKVIIFIQTHNRRKIINKELVRGRKIYIKITFTKQNKQKKIIKRT